MGLTRPKYNNLDTSKFEIDDPITELNTGLADANPNFSDVGLIFNRGDTGNNVALLWDKSAQGFILAETTASGDDVGDLPIGTYSDLQVRFFRCEGVVTDVHVLGEQSLILEGPVTGNNFYLTNNGIGTSRNISLHITGGGTSVIDFEGAGQIKVAATAPTEDEHLTRKDYVNAGDVYNTVTLLTTSDDLNSIITNGHYAWAGQNPANNPLGATSYNHMIVESDGVQYSQLVWGGTSGTSIIATRRNDSGTWQPWEMYAKESAASGSFTTVDNKTVTVTNGIITSIV